MTRHIPKPKKHQKLTVVHKASPLEVARNRARIAAQEEAVRAGKLKPRYLSLGGREL